MFGGREDLDVVQAVAPAADEGALELAQQLLGGFGAVLVDRVGPAAGDPGQEVGVVLRRPCASGRAPSGPAASASQACLTFSSARVMTVAARDATSPAATAAPSSSCTGGTGCPASPRRGSRRSARESRRRASAALISSRARRNSAVFRYPSSAATWASIARDATDPGTPSSAVPGEAPSPATPVMPIPVTPVPPAAAVHAAAEPGASSCQPVVHDVPAFAGGPPRTASWPGPPRTPRQPANTPPCGRTPPRARRSPTPPSTPRTPRPPPPSHSRPGVRPGRRPHRTPGPGAQQGRCRDRCRDLCRSLQRGRCTCPCPAPRPRKE